MNTAFIYKEQVEDVFVLKDIYNLDMLNKADIDGNLTTGGIWWQDQVLSDRFTNYKQVWTALTNNTIEWGNIELDKHIFLVDDADGLKIKVGSTEGAIWNTLNLTNVSQLNNDAGYLQANDLDGFIYDVQYNSATHTITFYQQNEPNIVIDLPIEQLIKGVQLVGNDLIFTFEDGSTVTVPLNTLLVGVVKSVNGLTPNSQGEIILNVTDIPNLSSELANKLDIRMAGLVNNLTQPEKDAILTKLGIVNNIVQVLGLSGNTITLSNGGGSISLNIANIGGLQSELNLKAPLANPIFTGNVGIATPTANERLSLPYGSKIGFTFSDTNSSIANYISKPITGNSALTFGATYAPPPTDIIFNFIKNGAVSVLAIQQSGNVGIGEPSPAYKLDVSGTGRFTGNVTAPNATLNSHAVNLGQLNTILGDYATETWVSQQINNISIPTVNDGQLSIATGTGLSGSVNFTANQVGNSSVIIDVANTHKLPTITEWNALPTANTITRLRGTTGGTFTSGDLTLLAGVNTTITQSGANITIASTNTNTTYSAGAGLSLTGTVFGQVITTNGSGSFVTGITQTTNGFQINLGTPPNTNTTYTGSNGINVTGTVISPTYGTSVNTIAQGNDSRIINGQTAFGWGNHASMNYWRDDYITGVSSGTVTDLDSSLAQGGFRAGYSTATWGGADRPNGASYGGYIKFKGGNSDNNNLDFYYNNGHGGSASRLWYRTKNGSGITNWMEIIHTDNLDSQATSLGFIKSSALPTVNNGQLTLSTGTGLSGSATFTANQSGSSAFSVAVASTHKLPTTAEWNALPTTNTITRLRGTASGTYTSGDLTLINGAGIGVTQSGTNFTITNTSPNIIQTLSQSGQVVTLSNGGGSFTLPTNTTYTAGTGLSLTGTTFGQTITTNGSGTFVTGVTQTANGFQVNLGTPAGGSSGIETIGTDNSSSPGPANQDNLVFNFHEYWGLPPAYAKDVQVGNATAKANDDQLDFYASYDSVQTIIEYGDVDVALNGYHITNVLLMSGAGSDTVTLEDGVYAGDQVNITTFPNHQIVVQANNLIATTGGEVYTFVNLIWDCELEGWVITGYGTV